MVTEETVCGETAAKCRCVKPPGHVAAGDEVHACDPEECTGAWTGEWTEEEAGTFRIVRLPFPPDTRWGPR